MDSITLISFSVPATEPNVTSFYGLSVVAADIYDLADRYPAIFWIEPNCQGDDRICCVAVDGFKRPELVVNGITYEAQNFEYYEGKTSGDRVWHPSTRPQRPV